MIRDRDETGFRKFTDDVRQSREVEPAVHGGEKRHPQPTEQRKREPIDVGVDHVKVSCPFRNRFQQYGAR